MRTSNRTKRRNAAGSIDSDSVVEGKVSWDIFIAHANKDVDEAEALFNLLAPNCRVFLASHSLLPGDDWDVELARAQHSARVTVVLISTNTNKAYYEREEIASAIKMSRQSKIRHRVVPVYLGNRGNRKIDVPYGLSVKHSLKVSDICGLPNIAQQLIDLLAHTDRLANYTTPVPSDNIVTEIFKASFYDFDQPTPWLSIRTFSSDFFSEAGDRYKRRIEERNDSMRIFGMDKPVPLRSIYARVNILERITARHRATVKELETFFDRDRRSFGSIRNTLDGVKVVNALQRFIVLGKPGAGKTTFLKYIALQAVNGALAENHVPVFIGLKDWSDSGRTLITYIVEQFDICDFPDNERFIEHMLREGRCLLLLDGFDEVNSNIDEAIAQIRDFANKYPANQIILSCRIAGYNYCFEYFSDVEIADFNDDQIEMFINNWFGGQTTKALLCWDRMKHDKSIRELAAIPLLLTLMCLAFDETMGFPSNRAELYKEALDALLKKWDASKSIKRAEIYRHLSIRRKENMLSRIASATFERGEYFLPQRVLERQIALFIQNLPETTQDTIELDSEVILKAVESQHGLFVERATGIYSFSHLTFQEYFTARHIVDNASNGAVERLIKEHAMDDKWREVCLLTAGMLADADSFILLLEAEKDKYLVEEVVRDCLCEVVKGIRRLGHTFSNPLYRAFGLGQVMAQDESARSLIVNYIDDLLIPAIARGTNVLPEEDQVFTISFTQALQLNRGSMFAPSSPHKGRVNECLSITPLADYLKSTQLLVDCLNTECYISKAVRQKAYDGLLSIDLN